MNANDIILLECLKHHNNWNEIYNAIKNKEEIGDDDRRLLDSFDGHFITLLDDAYPKRLRNRFKPPFVLYYEGDISLLSHVDDNGGKNDLIFLHGPNSLGIPEDNLCVITSDNRLSMFGGRLTVWFNDDSTNPDRYGLAAALCQKVACTKVYEAKNFSWFTNISVPSAIGYGCDLFVVPGRSASWNSLLLDEGATPLTSAGVLTHQERIEGVQSPSLPF